MSDLSGGRVRGRQRFGWMDCVTIALGSRGTTVDAARQSAKDRKEWQALVHMQIIEFHSALFAWSLYFRFDFRTALERSGGLSPGEGWDAVT